MKININKNDYLIGINMESIVNGKHLAGYVLIPVDLYKTSKVEIDSLSVRIDGTGPEDDVYTKITISRDKLKSLFTHGDFLNENKLMIDMIDHIAEQTNINYDFILKFNAFMIDEILKANKNQFNTITLKENLIVDSLTEIPAGTKMTYSIPMPEMLTFEM